MFPEEVESKETKLERKRRDLRDLRRERLQPKEGKGVQTFWAGGTDGSLGPGSYLSLNEWSASPKDKDPTVTLSSFKNRQPKTIDFRVGEPRTARMHCGTHACTRT